MVRFYPVFMFLFFSLAGGCYAQNDTSVVQPKVEDSYLWDFGSVKKGEILKHDFRLKNDSERILNIGAANASCDCIVAGVKKNKLAPAEETQVSVQFDTAGYHGSSEQFVYVNTDDPVNPILRFTLRADVVE
jgi:hypothetical protein